MRSGVIGSPLSPVAADLSSTRCGRSFAVKPDVPTHLQVVTQEFRDLRLNAEMDGRAIDAWRILTRLRRGRG